MYDTFKYKLNEKIEHKCKCNNLKKYMILVSNVMNLQHNYIIFTAFLVVCDRP